MGILQAEHGCQSIYSLGSLEFPESADIDLKQANLHMPGLGWEGFVVVMGE
jgi:hypothetical protein